MIIRDFIFFNIKQNNKDLETGKIIARYVGEGEDIYIKLDELLQ